MRVAIIVIIALLAGCTNSFSRMKAMRDNAPEWYAARKVEISGQGYPKIGDIPVASDTRARTASLSLSQAEVNAAIARFKQSGRAELAAETPEAMLEWAAVTRRAVEGQIPVPDFLTDEEVIAIKATFDRPRGRL